MHRIRSSTQRLRLGTPRLDGRGIGQDPNSVAEYLDNTLPPESVPEFERVCLESDVHLAEVVSCHQILTLVLGEPAETGDSLRARIYQTPTEQGERVLAESELAPEAPSSDQSQEDAELLGAPPESAVRVSPRVQPDRRAVPKYMLVGSRLPFRSFAITLICGFVLALVALRVMGPFGSQHPLWQLVSGDKAARVADQPGAGSEREGPVSTAERPTEPAGEPTPIRVPASLPADAKALQAGGLRLKRVLRRGPSHPRPKALPRWPAWGHRLRIWRRLRPRKAIRASRFRPKHPLPGLPLLPT